MNEEKLLEGLRESTERTPHGLQADDRLKNRIMESATGAGASGAPRFRRLVPAMVALSAVMVLVFAAFGGIPAGVRPDEPRMISIAAGTAKDRAVSLTVGSRDYRLLPDGPGEIALLEKLGEVGEADISSTLFPDGSAVFATDRADTLAVVSEDRTVFLEQVPDGEKQ